MFNTEGMTPADMAAVMRNDNDGMNGGWFIWVLLIFVLFGWGGNGFGNNGGNALTQQEMQAGFNNQNVIGKLDRLGDGISSLGYDQLAQMNGLQRDLCTGFTSIASNINNARFENQQCLGRFVKAIKNLFTKNVNTVGTYA